MTAAVVPEDAMKVDPADTVREAAGRSPVAAIRARGSGWAWPAVAVTVFAVAFAVRLVPLLRGGGFKVLGNYDDGVYYTSAVGWIHGLMPYRDFVLLHPPGVVLLLAPFAALGRVVGDPVGWAAGRLTWMLLGSVCAVLVARFLRPLGLVAAVVGGLFYATFFAGAYAERSTMLEGPPNILLMLSLTAVSRTGNPRSRQRLMLVLAGAALAASVLIKIWMAPAVLLIVLWLWWARSGRRAAWFLFGAVAGGLVGCLPFLLAAPRQMWQMVVLDQVGRPWANTVWARLNIMAGLSQWRLGPGLTPVLAVTLAGLLLLLVLAFTVARARLAAGLLVLFTAVLLYSPLALLHYGALVAAPSAVVVGAGTARLARLARRASPGVVVIALLVMTVWAAPTRHEIFGRAFAANRLARAATATPGCITTDDPATLIELDLMQRNLARGCRFVADLSGASYGPSMVTGGPRRLNTRWNAYALRYLRSGSLVLLARGAGAQFSGPSIRTIRSWPTIAQAGPHRLQRPLPPPH
jgi:alpha-1,2-mannosyltransferase